MATVPWYQRRVLHYGVGAPIGTALLLVAGRTTLGFIIALLVTGAIGAGIGLAEDELP